MAQLEAEFRFAMGVDEVDDPAPGFDLFGGIESGAARGDPAYCRDTGHLGIDQPGAALRAFAIMNQMEIVRDAVCGRIHRHGRDDDAVRQLHLP